MLAEKNAKKLLADLENRVGLRIAARSGKLAVKPRKKITPEILQAIRENKPELLRLVRTKNLDAQRIRVLRRLFQPPGLCAMEMLSAIRPRFGTYFGLTSKSVTPPRILQNFAVHLDRALSRNKSFKYVCTNRNQRKEILLLGATLLPSEWHIQAGRKAIFVHPPENVPIIENKLLVIRQTAFNWRMIHGAPQNESEPNHAEKKFLVPPRT